MEWQIGIFTLKETRELLQLQNTYGNDYIYRGECN